jgi:hypothetical protein
LAAAAAGVAVLGLAGLTTATSASAGTTGVARPQYAYGCNGSVCLTLTNDGYARVSAKSAFTGHFQFLTPGYYYNTSNRHWVAKQNVSWYINKAPGKYCAIAWKSRIGGYTKIGEACEYVY